MAHTDRESEGAAGHIDFGLGVARNTWGWDGNRSSEDREGSLVSWRVEDWPLFMISEACVGVGFHRPKCHRRKFMGVNQLIFHYDFVIILQPKLVSKNVELLRHASVRDLKSIRYCWHTFQHCSYRCTLWVWHLFSDSFAHSMSKWYRKGYQKCIVHSAKVKRKVFHSSAEFYEAKDFERFSDFEVSRTFDQIDHPSCYREDSSARKSTLSFQKSSMVWNSKCRALPVD